MWICPICETHNEESTARCAICGSPRGVTVRDEPKPPSPRPSQQPTRTVQPRVTSPTSPPTVRVTSPVSPPTVRVALPARSPLREPLYTPPVRRPSPPKPRKRGAKVVIALLAVASLAAVGALFLTGRDMPFDPMATPTVAWISSVATAAPAAARGIWVAPAATAVVVETAAPAESAPPIASASFTDASEPYAMDTPWLGDRVYQSEEAGIDVLWAQTQLRTLGYYAKSGYDITGCMGSRTVNEIKRFQKKRNLSNRSGTLDQETVEAIAFAQFEAGIAPQAVFIGGYYDRMPAVPDGGLTVGDTGEAVRWTQACLNRLGYAAGDVDGSFGKQTGKAVSAFQKDYGYQQTGLVKLGILRKMTSAYYERYGETP